MLFVSMVRSHANVVSFDKVNGIFHEAQQDRNKEIYDIKKEWKKGSDVLQQHLKSSSPSPFDILLKL